MDHHEQHHQHHQKEREERIKHQKEHDRAQEALPRQLHPAWFWIVGIVLTAAIIATWTVFF